MPKCTKCGKKEPAMRCIYKYCLDRLVAYEATGLEPKDCKEYKKFKDILVESGVPFRRIIELVRAEQKDNKPFTLDGVAGGAEGGKS